MTIHYTVAFLRRGDEVLLINRNAAPLMGLWNGVGGKLEQGETPEQSVIREIQEETGIKVEDVQHKGIVTWNIDGEKQGGMYVFVVDLPPSTSFQTPLSTDEGILEWKKVKWILDEHNMGVPSNIPYFAPAALEDANSYHHHFLYESNKIVSYEKKEQVHI